MNWRTSNVNTNEILSSIKLTIKFDARKYFNFSQFLISFEDHFLREKYDNLFKT